MPGIIPTAPKLRPLPGAGGGGIAGKLHLPGVKAALLNVLTLGAYQHPQEAQDYWTELAHELDPRTPQGLVALGATVFGPRLDDPMITSLETPRGLVPLPRAGNQAQRFTSDPMRNLKQDFAPAALARALRARESEPISKHIESVAHRASVQAMPEDMHAYAEGNDSARGEPHRPPSVLHESLRPSQIALLRMLLARERMA